MREYSSTEFITIYREWYSHARMVMNPKELRSVNSHIVAFAAKSAGSMITRKVIQDYIDELCKTNPYSATRLIRAFRKMLGPNSIAEGLKRKESYTRLAKISVTPEQFQQILKDFSRGYQNRHKMLVVILMWSCGCSIIDACRMKWSDVDLTKMMISFRRSKTKVMSHIPIETGGYLHQILVEFENKRAKKDIYVSDVNEKNYGSSRWEFEIRSAFINAGLPKGQSTHCFRRAFITRMNNAGMPHQMIMKMSGHASLAQMLDYFTPSESEIKSQYEKAIKLLGSGRQDDAKVLPTSSQQTRGSSKLKGTVSDDGGKDRLPKGSVDLAPGQLGENHGGGNVHVQESVRDHPGDRGDDPPEVHQDGEQGKEAACLP